MKRFFIIITFIFLLGFGCADDSSIVSDQQKQINELSAKLESLSQVQVASADESVIEKEVVYTPQIIEKVVTIKEGNLEELEKLEEKIKELESEPQKNLKDVYQSFAYNVVKIKCGNQSGSGTIIEPYRIQTNYHVVKGYSNCDVGFTTNLSDTVWVSGAELIEKNEYYDKAILYVEHLLANKSTKRCDVDDFEVYDKLVVIGFPGTGGDTMTNTNGIVIGFLNYYIKTSAKISYGNSGGAAIHESGCYLGLPTSVVVSDLESLGYIVNDSIGSQAYNSGFVNVAEEEKKKAELLEKERQEEIEKYEEYKDTYDKFVSESKLILDNHYKYTTEIIDVAIDDINKQQYDTAISTLTPLPGIMDEFVAINLKNIKSFEDFEDIQTLKDNFRLMLTKTKSMVFSAKDWASNEKFGNISQAYIDLGAAADYETEMNNYRQSSIELRNSIISRGNEIFY